MLDEKEFVGGIALAREILARVKSVTAGASDTTEPNSSSIPAKDRCEGTMRSSPSLNVGEIRGETRIPAADTRGGVAGKITTILDRGPKTDLAHHGAGRAGKTTTGDVVPTRMGRVRL
jgi:hypothetical protein